MPPAPAQPGLRRLVLLLRAAGDDAKINIEVIMRIALIVVGVLLMFFGAVWFFQGINVLPGSFMTGQMQWAVYGGIAFAAGVIAAYLGWRRSRPPKQQGPGTA
jgi:hypothetical protein